MHVTDLKSEKGGLLISILFLIFFLGTFGIIVSRMVVSETKMNSIYTGQQQAFYAAEAGIEYAVKKLNDDINWRDGAANISLGDGEFTVTVDDSTTISALNDSILVTSVGQAGMGVKTLKTYLLGGEAIDVLLVVSTIPPNSRDAARKSLMESWGFTVALLNDGSSQSVCDAAVVDKDVIYISEECWGPTVGDKFSNYAIGVVSEEDYIDDRLKFASQTGGLYFSTGVIIENNTHYITSPFSLGFLQILNWLTFLPYLRGTLAPGRQTLAKRNSSNETFVAVEQGATLYGGTPAPGRRVRLGWGLFSFSTGLLNADGKTIMKRSIEWASGVNSSVELRIVKWVER